MDNQKKTQKPPPGLQRTQKKIQSFECKVKKIQLFYCYRLPSIYRELRVPLFQISKTKTNLPRNINKNISQVEGCLQKKIQILYKKVMLNSKYHHRQKMRFSRMPLLKMIQYDFQSLAEKLKSKSYCKIYDDLEESDEQDTQEKKQYELDPHFSEESILKYKKKHGINGKIVISHGYEDIKERLVSEYGWVVNPDTSSKIYDYKHMSKKKDIDYVNLLESQGVNHYNENKSVTAKFGLTRNIRNLASIGKDVNKFFPRCFDVNDVSEFQNFFQNFKQTYCQSLLKDYVKRQGKIKKEYAQIGQKVIRKCLQATYKRCLPVEKKIKLIQEGKNLVISFQDWKLMEQYEKINKKEEMNENQFIRNQQIYKQAKQWEDMCSGDPQWGINKDNIWIVKPASMSRGRGIKTFDNFSHIIDYVIGKEISWVVQKYIENPLIIRKRKFDIRQWVLLTDFKPYRIWVYDECYVRFCSTQYNPENLKDRKVHLTNNSVTKGVSDIYNDGIEENMMDQQAFRVLLKQKQGYNVFQDKIRPQMDKFSVQTLQSVKENIIGRKNTMQVFGFDYMIDDQYKVWLIEVNSSPTMDKSTKVTERIVTRGMSDYADLVNNYLFKGKVYKGQKAKQLYGGWRLLTGF